MSGVVQADFAHVLDFLNAGAHGVAVYPEGVGGVGQLGAVSEEDGEGLFQVSAMRGIVTVQAAEDFFSSGGQSLGHCGLMQPRQVGVAGLGDISGPECARAGFELAHVFRGESCQHDGATGGDAHSAGVFAEVSEDVADVYLGAHDEEEGGFSQAKGMKQLVAIVGMTVECV